MCKVLEKLLAKVKAHLVYSHIKVSTSTCLLTASVICDVSLASGEKIAIDLEINLCEDRLLNADSFYLHLLLFRAVF